MKMRSSTNSWCGCARGSCVQPRNPTSDAPLSTAGDHDLGVKNWDDGIATFRPERFAAETGFDPLGDPVALNEVLV